MIPERFQRYYEPRPPSERREAYTDLRTRRYLAWRERWAEAVGCVLWIFIGLAGARFWNWWFLLAVLLGGFGLKVIQESVEIKVRLAVAADHLITDADAARIERSRMVSLLTVVATHLGQPAVNLAKLGLSPADLAELESEDLIVYEWSPVPSGWYLTGAGDLLLAEEREEIIGIPTDRIERTEA